MGVGGGLRADAKEGYFWRFWIVLVGWVVLSCWWVRVWRTYGVVTAEEEAESEDLVGVNRICV